MLGADLIATGHYTQVEKHGDIGRLLRGLEEVDWSDSLKEQQRNWIGKSIGTDVEFAI